MHVFKMRSAKAYRYQSLSLLWRLVPCTFLALLCLYFYPHFNNSSPPTDPHPYSSYITYNPSLSAPVLFPPPSYSGILLAEKHKAPLLALSPNSGRDRITKYTRQIPRDLYACIIQTSIMEHEDVLQLL
ncbi:uncharacterized protein LOC130739974 isoform X2 [Lotus japonicus]|uniref:uncharacterized protein LOC130739974 isoform X2 n=1 Tax=Lotus japonicus TaxID=34305 RepID=UPI002586492F|nr:uncharacterized protein LOC130739974 isoform X2 [Lotus japonicus]